MPFQDMRDYVARLRTTTGLRDPGLVALAVLVLTSLAFFRVALLPDIGSELAMSTFQLGAVTTIFGIGRLSADLPGGHLADRIPARGLLAASAGGIALGSLVIGLSAGLATLYLASFVLGLCSSTTNATGMTYFSGVSGPDHRGTSMAVFSAALLGGQALGPAVAGVLAGVTGWRPAMYVAAGSAAVVGAVLALSVRRAGSAPSSPRDRHPRGGVGRGSMAVLQSVSFAVFLTLGSVPQTLVPVMGSETLGLTTTSIGLALGLGGLSRFVGTLIGGRLSDRISRKAALVPGLILQGAGVGLLALGPSVAVWLAAIVVMSIASFAASVAATIVGDLADPSRVGSQLGRFRFAGDVGLIVGPISVSAVYETAGRPAAFLLVATLLVGVALVCLKALPETRATARSATGVPE